ncbi:nuclear protein 96-domain-containing protein [Multifurca ochricompacta]|uniref:Nuclear protein 96-domain-containing protein n=1 Tax=Multifurca ochricompacta TaxID=376703 RepID=A0AAD4M485_9AGAM|nr:nuclear protein 96-domain-containing protein [Multifurca ochricompacta]
MARFSALASDNSDDDEQYVASPPKKHPPPRTRSKFPPPRVSRVDEDAEMVSDSDSSRGDEEVEELPSDSSHFSVHDQRKLGRGDGGIYTTEEPGDKDESGESSGSGSEAILPEHRRGDPSMIPWAQRIGVDPQKMHVMQASLFGTSETAEALKQLNAEKPDRAHLTPNGLHRKHSRESEGEGRRATAQERASFAHDIEPVAFRPSRKYARVESSASIVNGVEDAIVDAGLAFGRSFRHTANSSVITKTAVPFSEPGTDASLSTKLLSHHLTNSPIQLDGEGIPFARPSPKLSFASFASLFPSTEQSFAARLFRLGHALFDEIDLQLNESVGIDVRNRAHAVRRKEALSKWLEGVVALTVGAEVKSTFSGGSFSTIFSLLTGHQIDKACEVAMDSGNLRLATLLSQAGGDTGFRADIRTQLQIWQEQRIDPHIDENLRKIYALLGGVVDVLEGSNGTGVERCPDLAVSKKLDWKRVFGLHLWFGQPMDASIAEVFDAYDNHWRNARDRAAAPNPWYFEDDPSELKHWHLSPDENPPDAFYSLIRLYADPACSLETVFSPLSFGPSPVDFSILWHLYIVLSRSMRIRDFSDRDDPGVSRGSQEGDDGEEYVEGHSPNADVLASTYALQLEQQDLIQEATFVLLHLEGSSGREKAIRDLLLRSAPKLDDWMTRGMAGSLKIPLLWINEAKAIYALNRGDVFEAYHLYLKQGYTLAPEAVIREDLELLKTLFERFIGHTVQEWHVRGKAFLDYAHAMTRLPELVQDVRALRDGSHATELEELIRGIPKLIGLLPEIIRDDEADARHSVAVAMMITGLTRQLDKAMPLALSPKQLRNLPVDEATNLQHARTTAHSQFLKMLEAT